MIFFCQLLDNLLVSPLFHSCSLLFLLSFDSDSSHCQIISCIVHPKGSRPPDPMYAMMRKRSTKNLLNAQAYITALNQGLWNTVGITGSTLIALKAVIAMKTIISFTTRGQESLMTCLLEQERCARTHHGSSWRSPPNDTKDSDRY